MLKKVLPILLYSSVVYGNLQYAYIPTNTGNQDVKQSIDLRPRDRELKLKAAVTRITKYPFTISEDKDQVESLINTLDAKETQEFINNFEFASHNEDVLFDFEKLVNKYGFPFENHEVFTDDGYVLSLFRIPSNNTKNQTVFLMHGLLGSADDFVIAGVESGLAYLLSRKGFDVWLGNARGNKHSRRHILLDPSKSAFWDFSWHEIGTKDLPALIDYILFITYSSTLIYIGHGQGTTAFFVMASVKPEYNSKIAHMIALSPIAYMGRVRSPIIRLLSPESLVLQAIARNIGVNEFSPNMSLITMLKKFICGGGVVVNIICNNPLFLLSGFDFGQLNVTNLPVVLGHMPSGSSMKQFTHYGQSLIYEEFRYYDYGTMENYERYGVVIPPNYSLSNVVAPVSLFYSSADWLADPKDVLRLSSKLKNLVNLYRVPLNTFTYLDFIIGKEVNKLVYVKLFDVLNRTPTS